jgi:hypothetical protein
MLRPALMIFDDRAAALEAGTEQRIRSAMCRPLPIV